MANESNQNSKQTYASIDAIFNLDASRIGEVVMRIVDSDRAYNKNHGTTYLRAFHNIIDLTTLVKNPDYNMLSSFTLARLTIGSEKILQVFPHPAVLVESEKLYESLLSIGEEYKQSA